MAKLVLFLVLALVRCWMPVPTEAQLKTQAANYLRMLNNHRTNVGITATTNFISLENAFNQALFTGFYQAVAQGQASVRAAMAAVFSAGPQVMTAFFMDYMQVIGSAPESDPVTMGKRLYQYYIDNTLSVLTRNFTFGTPTFSGANGNGTINRLNVDENNKNIDNQYPDAKTAYCIADEHGGRSKHQEQFEFRGSQREIDELKRVGSGAFGTINAVSANDVQPYLSNPSFENYTGTAAVPTAITDWTVTTNISNFSIDTTNTYRDYDGVGTSASVKWAAAANDTLTQNVTTRRANFKRGIPYYFQLAWNRSIGSGDGTLTFTVGNVSANVVMSAQSGWQILRIVIGQNNWLTQFDLNTLNVAIARSSATTGTVLVDDIIIAPYTQFDGSWYCVVGGSTKFLVKDKATWSDSVSAEGVIQHFLWRFFNIYLPSVTSGPTWSDPVAP